MINSHLFFGISIILISCSIRIISSTGRLPPFWKRKQIKKSIDRRKFSYVFHLQLNNTNNFVMELKNRCCMLDCKKRFLVRSDNSKQLQVEQSELDEEFRHLDSLRCIVAFDNNFVDFPSSRQMSRKRNIFIQWIFVKRTSSSLTCAQLFNRCCRSRERENVFFNFVYFFSINVNKRSLLLAFYRRPLDWLSTSNQIVKDAEEWSRKKWILIVKNILVPFQR